MDITVTNQQQTLRIDEPRLADAARSVLVDAGYGEGELSIAVVTDPEIHELNRRSLDHDYPTDVLSFCLDEAPGRLEGEVVVSADTAVTNAAEYGMAPEDELLLYVVHGALHLAGLGDKSDDQTREMRAAETRYMQRFGVRLPSAPAEPSAAGAATPSRGEGPPL
ncbi:rRNA maturation RNase YbeY [Pseudobythopirellula maris]|nr:rRNA maturation RNase YbeY [Pseudobythopirellula maris]